MYFFRFKINIISYLRPILFVHIATELYKLRLPCIKKFLSESKLYNCVFFIGISVTTYMYILFSLAMTREVLLMGFSGTLFVYLSADKR